MTSPVRLWGAKIILQKWLFRTIEGLKNAFKRFKVIFDVNIPKCTTCCGALALGFGWLRAGPGWARGDVKARSQVVRMGGQGVEAVTHSN